jgi:translation initiation factor IF-2
VGEGDRRRVIIAPRQSSGQAPRHGPATGSTSSPQAGSGQRSGQAPRPGSGQAPRHGPTAGPTGSGQRSGQAPRQSSGQAPRQSSGQALRPGPSTGSGQRSGQAPRPGSGQALPQKQKPQPETMPKPMGKPGRRDSGRRPLKPMERQEQPVRQPVKPQTATDDIPPAPQAPEIGEAGFVPRSKKKSKRP